VVVLWCSCAADLTSAHGLIDARLVIIERTSCALAWRAFLSHIFRLGRHCKRVTKHESTNVCMYVTHSTWSRVRCLRVKMSVWASVIICQSLRRLSFVYPRLHPWKIKIMKCTRHLIMVHQIRNPTRYSCDMILWSFRVSNLLGVVRFTSVNLFPWSTHEEN